MIVKNNVIFTCFFTLFFIKLTNSIFRLASDMGRRPREGDVFPTTSRTLYSICAILTVFIFPLGNGLVLTPPNWNLAQNRRIGNFLDCFTINLFALPTNFFTKRQLLCVIIEATFTCGEVNGRPIKEMYCTIAGKKTFICLNSYSIL